CLFSAAEPRYPKQAMETRTTGSATITGTIANDGTVVNLKRAAAMSEPAGDEDLFVAVALANVRTWRLQKGGRPEPLTMTYRFVIDSSVPEGFDELLRITGNVVFIGLNPKP